MTDLPTDSASLEERFRRHGVSMRHLNPWWVRLYRLLGLRPKPPILFSLAEHFYWEGTSIAMIAVAAWLIGAWEPARSPHMLVLFFAMAIVLPFVNWLIRRRIRARIGL